MKKIICFTESLGGGGAEHQMVILAGMLAEAGYDTTLVTYASLPDYYDTPKDVKRLDIGSTKANNRIFKACIKIFKIFHYFLRVKADCIISYRECANLRVLPPLFIRSKRIQVICSDRNTSQKLSFKHKMLLCILYRRVKYIVPNSKTETDFIAFHKPQLKPKLRTIHNYTDLFQFIVSPIPTDTAIVRIGIFSRYSEQKNPIGFAYAIYMLKQRSIKSFEIHWYGSQEGKINGYNSEYISFRKKIFELGIEDVLKLCPAVKNPAIEMPHYHAVCLPSLYEGFSNSIAEGICSGKPMLVSDVSDNSVMVHNRENGFLFDPTNAESICNAFLQFFCLSHEEMCRMALRSREIAESLFDKERFIQQYISLIES